MVYLEDLIETEEKGGETCNPRQRSSEVTDAQRASNVQGDNENPGRYNRHKKEVSMDPWRYENWCYRWYSRSYWGFGYPR